MNFARRIGIVSVVVGLCMTASPEARVPAAGWKRDWPAGQIERAVYAAQRDFDGKKISYEASMLTWPDADENIAIFRQTCSEVFARGESAGSISLLASTSAAGDPLSAVSVVVTAQSERDAMWTRFTAGADEAEAHRQRAGAAAIARETFPTKPDLAFHDALPLTLRDYPFDAAARPLLVLRLVGDQFTLDAGDAGGDAGVSLQPAMASVEYIGREMIKVPHGSIETHHLQVAHAEVGGASVSDYWFAASPELRRVLVKYRGPFGVEYELEEVSWIEEASATSRDH